MAATAFPIARLRRLRLESRRHLAGFIGGGHRSRFLGHGLEFSELRPYQPGDDPRHIDWNVTARSGQPHVRRYREEHDRTILLLADLSTSMLPAKFDLLRQTAALLAFAAVAQRDRVGLIGFAADNGPILPPTGSESGLLRLLHRLDAGRPHIRRTRLEPPMEAADRLLSRPGMLLVLSDFHARLPERLMRRLAARHDCIALVLRDPAETRLPNALVSLVDAESGRGLLVDGRRAAPAWRQTDRDLHRRLRQCGFDVLPLAADAPPLPALARFFRRRSGA
ncbi:uncharacterized protein DUF58 [Geothermobacter ehrlichii]|uniref:Uncharacterized protein DUF58 n=1 Tax=Geothermobacter ehrlichii TaxID=213224 RepID=A0A5D3WII5_9BACT|nr:DUF58 domain-containing protein [Geothermobacter ehrlichii]TYO98274.1 uncharacterized protein DUF58 [Geothermobacter ehrlichii]